VISRRHLWHAPCDSFDVESMKGAARILTSPGKTLDFSSFTNKIRHAETTDPLCCIDTIRITVSSEVVSLDIFGTRFLYNMCRIIVGTLIDVGRRRKSVADVESILMGKDRNLAGQGAPARGLTLMKIWYEGQDDQETAVRNPATAKRPKRSEDEDDPLPLYTDPLDVLQ